MICYSLISLEILLFLTDLWRKINYNRYIESPIWTEGRNWIISHPSTEYKGIDLRAPKSFTTIVTMGRENICNPFLCKAVRLNSFWPLHSLLTIKKTSSDTPNMLDSTVPFLDCVIWGSPRFGFLQGHGKYWEYLVIFLSPTANGVAVTYIRLWWLPSTHFVIYYSTVMLV